MIATSLNLVGDEFLEEALEEAFAVRFTESEYASMVTVGAIHDVIRTRLPERGGSCETSMAFYRLLQGLLRMSVTGRIGPSTILPASFSRRTNAEFRSLSRETGLRLPATQGGPLMIGCLLVGAVGVVTLLTAGFLEQSWLGGFAAGLIVLGVTLAKLDPGRLPSGIQTVGDLARASAPLSFGILARQGSRVTDDLTWAVLREVISDVAEIDANAISRDTLIYSPRKAVA
jgi:hypothetical protein